MHGSLQFGTIDLFEHAVEKLTRALEDADARDQTENSKLEATKHVEAECVEARVDSRITVDMAHFRKVNPNYARPLINEFARPSSSDSIYILFNDTETEEVKKATALMRDA